MKDYLWAKRFFKKWDRFHLQDLTAEQYTEMRLDLEELKTHYNFIYNEMDETKKPYNPHFSFDRLAEWTKQKPKKG